jgi:hypothetical protein
MSLNLKSSPRPQTKKCVFFIGIFFSNFNQKKSLELPFLFDSLASFVIGLDGKFDAIRAFNDLPLNQGSI